MRDSISSLNVRSLLKFTAIGAIVLVLLHFAILGAFPPIYAGSWTTDRDQDTYDAVLHHAHVMVPGIDPAAGVPGAFFRDSYPIRSMLAFWELAKQEVAARNLDTCGDQLGEGLIDAYHQSILGYCLPRDAQHHITLANQTDANTRIWCAPVHRHPFSNWWPYPAAPCLSTHIRPIADKQREFHAHGCEITADGAALDNEMGREMFLGSNLRPGDDSPCRTALNHTAIVIGRQDQWNPFHVAEDLITTLVTVLIAARAAPELIGTRAQLVFVEGYNMDSNRYTPLWDRVGAWAPRRLALDPWEEGVCLTNAIHSVGAGASLLSAMGVGSSYTCASTITWAASHYYRHLFGLLPTESNRVQPINVLWLSREKLDTFAKEHGQWSSWRGIRHIENEDELLQRIRLGMRELCTDGKCVFEDAEEMPETWTQPAKDIVPLRFATIDPMVHALETQIQFVGHTNILVSSHGGALGLSLFLPPGKATLVELQVGGVAGNHHFQHMAYEMGHHYELVGIHQKIDVDNVWEVIRQRISASSEL
ncbi:hypothetical protein BD324DRAFT_580795 [Kockovaella imperatae]|uniref:Uncharacterized protein n=1 Tax=Kockovaella imperatae TaxID=4999 RepID=A0A1Y1UEJ2_9TREE|nr:hypothetical protein BD324DRAFT_580795 [Kockovaella imperatae]ORX36448.1 hypothetical protein BD324DRAFT_580795 [Kockovaella imperatae]